MATVAVQNNHNHQVPTESVHLNNKPQYAAESFWKIKNKTGILGNGKELNISFADPDHKKSLIWKFPKRKKFKTPIEKRRSRFYAALIQAFWERPNPKRWFVLTLTSRNQTENNDDSVIKRHFQALVKRWRRRGQFEYMGVVERGKGGMVHIHVIAYGDFIPQDEISRWWKDIHSAPIVFVESVHHYMVRKGLNYNDLTLVIRLMVGYVTKYLTKQNLSKRVLKSRGFDTLERRMMRTGSRLHKKIIEYKFEKWLFKYGHIRNIVGLKAALETEKGLHLVAIPIEFYFDGIIKYPRGDLTDDDESFIYSLN